MSSMINYRTQSVEPDPIARRISVGFLLLAIACIVRATLAALEVMVSDFSILPINIRMWLMAITRFVADGVQTPALVLMVIGFRIATRRYNAESGISKRLSLGAFAVAALCAVLAVITPYATILFFPPTDPRTPATIENKAFYYCVHQTSLCFIDLLASIVMAWAIYRVLIRLGLQKFANECRWLAAATSLYFVIQIALSLASYASFAGKVDYTTAKKILMLIAVGTLISLILLSWMSIFFIRTWNAIKKRGNVC